MESERLWLLNFENVSQHYSLTALTLHPGVFFVRACVPLNFSCAADVWKADRGSNTSSPSAKAHQAFADKLGRADGLMLMGWWWWADGGGVSGRPCSPDWYLPWPGRVTDSLGWTPTSAVVLVLLINLAVETGTTYNCFPSTCLGAKRSGGSPTRTSLDYGVTASAERQTPLVRVLFTCCCAVHGEAAACHYYASGFASVCFRGM